ncbi:MAG: DUF1294 domain-containing protein [Lysobacteraceae bacterium]|nr:MAG: DUF1294 domain-containing protein [Xanthomonadaceae bacterium]
MRYQGRITDWNDEKGYGFVKPHGGGESTFVHIKAFSRPPRRPADGDVITYSITSDAQGRLRAEDVRFAISLSREDDRAKRAASPLQAIATVFALFFVVGLLIAAWAGRLPIIVPVAYLAMSVVTFIAYGTDKSAAQAGAWRISEMTLQMLGLLGGWPGGLFAQRVFRHKSRKRMFQETFWAAVAINIVVLLAWAANRSPDVGL